MYTIRLEISEVSRVSARERVTCVCVCGAVSCLGGGGVSPSRRVVKSLLSAITDQSLCFYNAVGPITPPAPTFVTEPGGCFGTDFVAITAWRRVPSASPPARPSPVSVTAHEDEHDVFEASELTPSR